MMPKTKNVQASIAKLRPELPGLLGDRWPAVERALAELEKTLDTGGAAPVLFPSRVMSLFNEHENVQARLVGLIRQFEGNVTLDPMGFIKEPKITEDDSSGSMVIRYTDISCPDRVTLETPRISLVVHLRVSPPELSAALEELVVRAGSSVVVRMVSPDFAHIGPSMQEVRIERERDSQPVVFDLRPLRQGDTRITIEFFQDGSPIGTASVPVKITSEPTSANTDQRRGPALRLAAQVTPPDLVLVVSYEHTYGQHELRYTLFGTADGAFREFPPVQLTGDPRTIVGRYYQQILSLVLGLDPTAQAILGNEVPVASTDVDRRVRQLGRSLWNDLFPDDFKQVYARERASWKDKSLLIVSDEPWIPWELVWPYRVDASAGGDTWKDDEPWCMRFALTRWLRRDALGNGLGGAPSRLRLGALACIAPTDSGLPDTRHEHTYLATWLASHGLSNLSPAVPSSSAVMDLLERGALDWLHFATHGNFHATTPDMDSAVWLQGRVAFTPQQIVGPEIEQHIVRRQTAFVLNACSAARMDIALTGMGGWARQLIDKGAGLFLGPLWAVTDDAALRFVRAFYDALGTGTTMAEAVRMARRAARAHGDPSWLAYSVYAHPNATLVMQASHGAPVANAGATSPA